MSTPDTAQRIAGEAAEHILRGLGTAYIGCDGTGFAPCDTDEHESATAHVLRAADSIMLARLEQWGVQEALRATLDVIDGAHWPTYRQQVSAALAHLDALRKEKAT